MSTGRRQPRAVMLKVAATNACPTGKQSHVSRVGAKQHAARVRAVNGEHVRPYRCPQCLGWHIGHLPQAVIRGRVGAERYYGRDTPPAIVDDPGAEATG